MSFALAWMAPGIERALLVVTNQADAGQATATAADAFVSALLEWSENQASK